MEAFVPGASEVEVSLGIDSYVSDVPLDVQNCLWDHSLVKMDLKFVLYHLL